MKYANHLNLAIALAGVMVLLYTFSATFFSPAPSITVDSVRLRELGAARAAMSTEAGVALQMEATTQSLPVNQVRQRRELPQTPRSGDAGSRTAGGLVMPSGGQPRPTAGSSSVTGRRSSTAPGTAGGPGRVTSLPARSTTRVLQPGTRLPQADSPSGTRQAGGEPQRSGLVGSGGNTQPPGVPPPGMPQPRPGAEFEKRNEPTQPPPPPFRSSMPANRPPQ